MMQALQVTAPGQLSVIETDPPRPSPGEAVIAVHRVGVCGSDLHIIHGSNPFTVYPRIIGHEIAGRVMAAGAEVTAIRVGDRVVVDPVVSCGACDPCRRGHPNVCANLQVLGVHRDGGFATHLTVDQGNLHLLPDSVSWDAGVLVEPFSIAANVCARLSITTEDRVLIVGGGIIGSIVLMACTMFGAWTMVSDIDPDKLDFCRQLGAAALVDGRGIDLAAETRARTCGEGVTAVIDAACIPAMFQSLLECAAPGGRVGILGFSQEISPINQYEITRKELSVFGSRLNNRKFPAVIRWFAEGRLDPTRIVRATHPFAAATGLLNDYASRGMPQGKTIIRVADASSTDEVGLS